MKKSWIDPIIKKVAEEVAEEEGVNYEYVINVVDDVFRNIKKALKLRTLPIVSLGGIFLIKPMLYKIKTKILRNETVKDIYKVEDAMNRYEEIIERFKKQKKLKTPKERSEYAKEWIDKELDF